MIVFFCEMHPCPSRLLRTVSNVCMYMDEAGPTIVSRGRGEGGGGGARSSPKHSCSCVLLQSKQHTIQFHLQAYMSNKFVGEIAWYAWLGFKRHSYVSLCMLGLTELTRCIPTSSVS